MIRYINNSKILTNLNWEFKKPKNGYENMKSEKYLENSKRFYIIGLLFILVGLILINIDFIDLDYSIIGIGIILLVLGVNETIKSI